jgi:hypothetical protein
MAGDGGQTTLGFRDREPVNRFREYRDDRNLTTESAMTRIMDKIEEEESSD